MILKMFLHNLQKPVGPSQCLSGIMPAGSSTALIR